jgi:malic enzyme
LLRCIHSSKRKKKKLELFLLPLYCSLCRDVVAFVKPHALVGLSAAGPSWGEGVIQELCRHVASPLVFPLSNPTDKAGGGVERGQVHLRLRLAV